MKIKLEEYKFRIDKDFFEFVWNLGRIKTMKELGLFKKKFIKNFIKGLFNILTLRKRYKSYLFKIIVDGKLVGGLELTKLKGRIFNIGISIFEKDRKKGIAKNAIKQAFEFAKRKNVQKISGINDSTNIASINLVKSLGYKKIKEVGGEIFWEKKLK